MMLLVSLALAAQAVPAPEAAQEVVVIGQKLKAWRASIRFGKADQTFTVDASAQPVNGTWKLRVQDHDALDVGYIEQWQLTP